MKIYNSFGITPTNNFTSAGTDFYIPYIDVTDTEKVNRAIVAFSKGYKVSTDIMQNLITLMSYRIKNTELYKREYINILLLYLALDSATLRNKTDIFENISTFVSEYLVFDKNTYKPGLRLKCNDSLFVNSGIKVALPPSTMGIFENKSGKGNAGFAKRACVVDEDYSGFVHLSVAYTKDDVKNGDNVVFCGDKLIQMIIVPNLHEEYTEVTEDEYNEQMKNSERGDKAFGSSDVKH
jgi:dUTPase